MNYSKIFTLISLFAFSSLFCALSGSNQKNWMPEHLVDAVVEICRPGQNTMDLLAVVDREGVKNNMGHFFSFTPSSQGSYQVGAANPNNQGAQPTQQQFYAIMKHIRRTNPGSMKIILYSVTEDQMEFDIEPNDDVQERIKTLQEIVSLMGGNGMFPF